MNITWRGAAMLKGKSRKQDVHFLHAPKTNEEKVDEYNVKTS